MHNGFEVIRGEKSPKTLSAFIKEYAHVFPGEFSCIVRECVIKNDEKGDLITVGSGSSKTAVKVTEKPPTIGGIGIVCRGGGDPIIQNRLISLLSATFGVSSTKIYITEAEK